MNPFPEDWELLALFESEPTLSDRYVPWFYNCLVFESTRGDDYVRSQIEAHEEELKIESWQRKELRLSLELNWVRGLQVITGAGKDYLVASFRDPHLLDLEFHLKPTISLRWATSQETFPR